MEASDKALSSRTDVILLVRFSSSVRESLEKTLFSTTLVIVLARSSINLSFDEPSRYPVFPELACASTAVTYELTGSQRLSQPP